MTRGTARQMWLRCVDNSQLDIAYLSCRFSKSRQDSGRRFQRKKICFFLLMTTRNEKCVVFSVIADLCFRILDLTHVCALTRRRQKLANVRGDGRHTTEKRRREMCTENGKNSIFYVSAFQRTEHSGEYMETKGEDEWRVERSMSEN